MLCEGCGRYRLGWDGRPAACCEVCGQRAVRPGDARLHVDLARLGFLLGELGRWVADGTLADAQRQRIAAPYEVERRCATALYRGEAAPVSQAPGCHASRRRPAAAGAHCPGCGVHLVTADAADAARAKQLDEIVRAEAEARVQAEARRQAEARVRAEGAGRREVVRSRAEAADGQAVPPQPSPPPRSLPVASARRASPRGGRLLHELRPAFYENVVLFLGAFLVFAGSVYFAIYSWQRLGAFGPLVAGALLFAYATSFAGAGYLLQRRYRADLSARVLYMVATAVLPVALALAGPPAGAGAGVIVASLATVAALSGVALAILRVAASLFQRELGPPLARGLAALLLCLGLAPLTLHLPHWLAMTCLYAAMVPLLAMYRRIRRDGRVFERATVVFVVLAPTFYAVAVAARLSFALPGGLQAAELAPLVLLLAAAAIDLEASWRPRAHGVRLDLGVVAVLAHALVVLALVLAAQDAAWRVPTLLGAGATLAVAAIRHRRPTQLHLALPVLTLGAVALGGWPTLGHLRAFAGLFALPLVLAYAWLDRRWGASGAAAFARPCGVWTLGTAAIAVAVALVWGVALPCHGVSWAPALTVMPAASAALVLAWHRAGRAPAVGGAALLAAATTVVTTHVLGGGYVGLALSAAGCACALGLAARWPGRQAIAGALVGAAHPLLGGALALASFTVLEGAPRSDGAVAWLAVAAAAAAVAHARSSRWVWLVSLLSLLAASALLLATPAALRLLPGGLAVALLLLDGLARRRPGGAIAGLGRDAAALALVGLAGQLMEVALLRDLFAVAPSGAALSPLEPLVIAAALGLLALRDRRRWPAYAALVCLLASAHAVPRAIGPAAACAVGGAARCERLAEAWLVGAGGVMAALACLVRARRRPGELRRLFSAPMLDLAAIAAPLCLVRLGWSFVAHAGHVEPHLLVRRAVATLAAASLAAITHRSRAHALLSAGSLVLLGHGVALEAGGPATFGVAVAALVSLGLGWTLMRSTLVRGSLANGFARFTSPLALCSTLGALAAAVGVGASAALAGPTPMRLATEAVLALFAWLSCAWPLEGAPRWMPRLLGHLATAALVLFAIDARRLGGEGVHGLDLSLLALGCALAGRLLERSPGAAPAAAAFEEAVLLLCAAVVVTIGDAWDPVALALGAAAALLLWRRYPGLTGHPAVVLAGGALYLGVAGPVWSPIVLLVVASALGLAAWIGRRFGRDALARPAWTWARLGAWSVVGPCALALLEPSALALATPSPARVGALLAITSAAFICLRRGKLDWLLGAVATALLLAAVAPGRMAAWSLAAVGWQGLDHLARRRGWRASLVLGAIAPATASALVVAGAAFAPLRSPLELAWVLACAAPVALSLVKDVRGHGVAAAPATLAAAAAFAAAPGLGAPALAWLAAAVAPLAVGRILRPRAVTGALLAITCAYTHVCHAVARLVLLGASVHLALERGIPEGLALAGAALALFSQRRSACALVAVATAAAVLLPPGAPAAIGGGLFALAWLELAHALEAGTAHRVLAGLGLPIHRARRARLARWARALAASTACLAIARTELRLAAVATPIVMALVAVLAARWSTRRPAALASALAQLASVLAVASVACLALARLSWLSPAVGVAALGLVAPAAARLPGCSSAARIGWSIAGSALALGSAGLPAGASPAALHTAAVLATLGLAALRLGVESARTGSVALAHAAHGGVFCAYGLARARGVGGLDAGSDAIAAVVLAFAAHFASELLGRSRLAALARAARLHARLLPLVGASFAALPVLLGREPIGAAFQIGLAAAIGVLYSLASPRFAGGWTGIAAAVSFNLAACLFWVHTGRHDPLFHAVPLGLTLVVLAQVHRDQLGVGARRGLRTVGALLVYLTGLVEALSFSGGGHALALGGLALCGILLGFALAVRDLFVLGSAFLVLDVIANLTYQGIHRPVVGWTLLTALGLGFTTAGIVFQLRRAEIAALVRRTRHAMAGWD